MDEKQLKTSLWQRIIIILVAILLLGSTVLTYMFIVMSSGNSKQSAEDRVAQLEEEYNSKRAELQTAAQPVGEKYFEELKKYTSQVKSFNAAAANSAKLQITDLKIGTGRQLTEGDTDYMAYYIGWCPDGSYLDSSFNFAEDDDTTPISLKVPFIQPHAIEGWTQGVIGMKLGGVRQISIPGELAYGDTAGDRYCGMTNAPLKFVVLPLEADADLVKLNNELNDIYIKLYTASISQ